LKILVSKSAPSPSIVYNTYWEFAAKRQDVFYKKIENITPWSNDKIISLHKFTNTYRAADRVSQYLINDVIYSKKFPIKDELFRILLFKTFNKITTWEKLELELGEITYNSFNFDLYNQILTDISSSGQSIYSGAYIMTSGKSRFGHQRKHKNHLLLIEHMIKDGLAKKVKSLSSLAQLFNLLKSYPTIGNFLAYQYSIDINYGNYCNFDEMDFVVPGPGALDGITKCFSNLGDYNYTDIIKYVTERQDFEFDRLGIQFKNLWGRKLHLIDCQNLFCEVDKYSRVAHPDIKGISDRTRIKQKYKPTQKKIDYSFPPKWGINSNLENYYKKLSATTNAIEY